MSDSTDIEDLVRSWAAAVHAGDLDAVLAHHADDVVMFDVPPPHDVFERGRLRLDFDTYEVFVAGVKAELSLREFELLKFFVRHPHRVYERLQLLDLVWGRELHVEPRTVDVHVRRLRKHIERDDAAPELILTVRGVGYKWNPDALDA